MLEKQPPSQPPPLCASPRRHRASRYYRIEEKRRLCCFPGMARQYGSKPPVLSRAAIAAVSLLVFASLTAPSAVAATGADTIRRFYDALVGTMREGPALGAKGRYERLAPVIEQSFDLAYMTRMAVGPTWEKLAKDKQQEVT